MNVLSVIYKLCKIMRECRLLGARGWKRAETKLVSCCVIDQVKQIAAF